MEKTVENGKDELKQIKQGLSQQELEVEEFKNQLSEAQVRSWIPIIILTRAIGPIQKIPY